MKLAEALTERADLSRKLQEVRERIIRNAKHQDGEKPSEDPKVLIKEFDTVLTGFQSLVTRINKTNNQITLENGLEMVEALSMRDALKLQHSMYKSLAAEATPRQDRYSKSEIKFVSSINVADIQKLSEKTAKEYRELDNLIQQANWGNEIV